MNQYILNAYMWKVSKEQKKNQYTKGIEHKVLEQGKKIRLRS